MSTLEPYEDRLIKDIMKYDKNKVEITVNALNNMIDYMRKIIYKYTGDEHSDSATHPFDIPFLDYLISVRDNHQKKGDN